MTTLFSAPQPEQLDATSSSISPPLFRLLIRLLVCLVTIVVGCVLLAHLAAPQMARLDGAGRSLGLAEFGLRYLWLRTLTDLWGYPARDFSRYYQRHRMRKLPSIPAFATESPKI